MELLRRVLLTVALSTCFKTFAADTGTASTTAEMVKNEISAVEFLANGYYGEIDEEFTDYRFYGFMRIVADKETFSIQIYDLGHAIERAQKGEGMAKLSIDEDLLYSVSGISIDKANEILSKKTIELDNNQREEECRGFQIVGDAYLSIDEDSGKSPKVFQFKSYSKLTKFRIQDLSRENLSRRFESVGWLEKAKKKTSWGF